VEIDVERGQEQEEREWGGWGNCEGEDDTAEGKEGRNRGELQQGKHHLFVDYEGFWLLFRLYLHEVLSGPLDANNYRH
jgi:hypothetical protein